MDDWVVKEVEAHRLRELVRAESQRIIRDMDGMCTAIQGSRQRLASLASLCEQGGLWTSGELAQWTEADGPTHIPGYASDARLATRALAGDENALATLHERHPRMEGLAASAWHLSVTLPAERHLERRGGTYNPLSTEDPTADPEDAGLVEAGEVLARIHREWLESLALGPLGVDTPAWYRERQS